MQISSQTSRVLRLAVLFLAFLCAIYLLFQPSLSQITEHDYHEAYRIAVSGKKSVFTQGAMRTDIDGPFQNSTLVDLCRSRNWVPGLIITCEPVNGGVGIVRNVVLNCLRYAIEAGATGFIVPQIMGRGKTVETAHIDTPGSFEVFFDLPHFEQILSSACPRIQVIIDKNDLWDKPSTAKVVQAPPDLVADKNFVTGKVLAIPRKWSQQFKDGLNNTYPAKITADFPVVVSLGTPVLQFPLSYDDPLFVGNFGKTLRFREDIRVLAATVLYAMDQKYRLGIDADRQGIQPGQYYGAHLRTAQDARAAHWTSYEEQSNSYLSHAKSSNLRVIYLSSDNQEDTRTFQMAASYKDLNATTKEELLAEKGFEKELKVLQKLSWKQRLLVDYEVLLRSSIFGGTHESTFGWNIAMHRHVVVGNGAWTKIGGEGPAAANEGETRGKLQKRLSAAGVSEAQRAGTSPSVGSVPPQSFLDQYSVVFGPPSEGREFQLSMWP